MPLLCLGQRCLSTGPCGDSRLSGLEALDSATSTVPNFMVEPLQALCKEAALSAVEGLAETGGCEHLIEVLSTPTYQTCERLGALLLNSASATSCYCQAAELVATADHLISLRILSLGPPARHSAATLFAQSAAPVFAGTPAVLIGAIVVAAAAAVASVLRHRSHAPQMALDIL